MLRLCVLALMTAQVTSTLSLSPSLFAVLQAKPAYLSEREVVDVLEDFSSFQCRLQDIVAQLRSLQPRYYSIASSPLTVSRALLYRPCTVSKFHSKTAISTEKPMKMF